MRGDAIRVGPAIVSPPVLSSDQDGQRVLQPAVPEVADGAQR